MDFDKTLVKLQYVSKTFNGKRIFSNVNLDVKEGEIIGIVGESGIGKSTLLKILDKEIRADSDDTICFDKRFESVLIPQHPALWDNLNIVQNVSIVRELIHSEVKKIANKKSKELLGMLKIGNHLFKRYPNTLSGGEKQRVSIARGLAAESSVLLFDEVTSNIDPHNKSTVTNLINRLATEGKTILFATHDFFALRNLDCVIYKLEENGLKRYNESWVQKM